MIAESHIVCLPSKYGEGVPKVLLVPPGDSAELAAALRRLIEEPEAREVKGTAGWGGAEAGFGINEVIRRTHAFYRDLWELCDE